MTEETKKEKGQKSFKQSPLRLYIFCVFTLGIYFIYWFYKTWKQIKEHTNEKFNPILRTLGLFIPIFNIWMLFKLFDTVKSLKEKQNLHFEYPPGVLTFLFVLFSLLSKGLPDPW